MFGVLFTTASVLLAGSAEPRFSLASHPELSPAALDELVRRTGQPGEHHICVFADPSDPSRVWVKWTQGKVLVLWETPRAMAAAKEESRPGATPRDALVRTRRVVDLESDVVATDADVGGSPVAVTRAWLKDRDAACAANGEQRVVRRPPLPKLPADVLGASRSFLERGDYKSLSRLSRVLYKGMPRVEVLRLLGEPTYSPSDGQDYYPSRDRERRMPGAPSPSPVGLVIEYRQIKPGELGINTGAIESFEMTPIGE